MGKIGLGPVNTVTDYDTVISKLVSLGCEIEADNPTSASIKVYYETDMFFIPKPLKDGGYTEQHLDIIEREMAKFGLDLLPLDPLLH